MACDLKEFPISAFYEQVPRDARHTFQSLLAFPFFLLSMVLVLFSMVPASRCRRLTDTTTTDHRPIYLGYGAMLVPHCPQHKEDLIPSMQTHTKQTITHPRLNPKILLHIYKSHVSSHPTINANITPHYLARVHTAKRASYACRGVAPLASVQRAVTIMVSPRCSTRKVWGNPVGSPKNADGSP